MEYGLSVSAWRNTPSWLVMFSSTNSVPSHAWETTESTVKVPPPAWEMPPTAVIGDVMPFTSTMSRSVVLSPAPTYRYNPPLPTRKQSFDPSVQAFPLSPKSQTSITPEPMFTTVPAHVQGPNTLMTPFPLERKAASPVDALFFTARNSASIFSSLPEATFTMPCQ